MTTTQATMDRYPSAVVAVVQAGSAAACKVAL
jgi:hypothetical protein